MIFMDFLAMKSILCRVALVGALMSSGVVVGADSFDGDFSSPSASARPRAPQPVPPPADTTPFYLIGPGDSLNIFVWRNSDLSITLPVRPDGRVSMPLVEDLSVAGKTASQVAREIETNLGKFVRDPVVTVIVMGFGGPFSQQIRIVGEAAKPQALPYREHMSLLDVMIAVGGLTQFASGNKAKIVRVVDGKQQEYRARLDDLLRDGDIGANAELLPGDIVIIPESWF